MRKDGRRKLRRKMAELAEDEEIALPQRISQLIEQTDEYREFMLTLIDKSKLKIEGLDLN